MLVSISIPQNAKIKANVGSRLDLNDPLFEIINEEIININIANKIKVKPEKMFQHLTHIVGQQVEKGSVIAKKTTFFSSSEFVCEYSGILQNINQEDGSIDIRIENSERRNINSFFKGILEKIDKYKIQIEIENPTKVTSEEITSDFGGPIFNFKDESQYFSANEDQIKNHIVIGKHINANTLAKFRALEATGYIFEQGEVDPSLFSFAKVTDISKLISQKKLCLVSNLDKTIYLY